MKFYDRESELKELNRIYALSGNKMHFTVLLGRRRVGKTRLVEEFMRDKKGVYLFVSRKSSPMLLEEFSDILRDFYGNSPHFSRWDDLFEYVFTHADEPMVFVMDEFQNFRHSAPEVFSILQKVYDRYRNERNVHMIAMGSYISMMKRIFQDSGEPLFGRATEIMDLRGLSTGTVFTITGDMGFSPEESMELYSVFGGLPKYYVMLEEQGLTGRPLKDILERAFFTDFPILGEEVKGMLVEDFGAKYSPYFSILEAISKGNTTFTAISDRTGIKRDSLSKYLQVLRDDFGIITASAPVSMKRMTKRTRYLIADSLTEFWFRFVFSQSTLLESERYSEALERSMRHLPEFVSRRFEDVARELVRRSTGYEHCGSWWSRKGDEIDIVAFDSMKKEALFGEVKWRNRAIGCATLDELMEKSDLVGLDGFKKRYLLISKSGFTEKCKERMVDEGVLHWTLDDIFRMAVEST